MSEALKPKKEYRKRHLFARSLTDVVKAATKPMMDKQGKLYSALISEWPAIAGEWATVSRPNRLQFPTHEASGATLHLDVHPAKAPEMPYASEQIIERCARYFGYRAIDRLVFHPCPELAASARSKKAAPPAAAPSEGNSGVGSSAPSTSEAGINDMQELLQRMRQRIMSGDPEKKNEP